MTARCSSPRHPSQSQHSTFWRAACGKPDVMRSRWKHNRQRRLVCEVLEPRNMLNGLALVQGGVEARLAANNRFYFPVRAGSGAIVSSAAPKTTTTANTTVAVAVQRSASSLPASPAANATPTTVQNAAPVITSLAPNSTVNATPVTPIVSPANQALANSLLTVIANEIRTLTLAVDELNANLVASEAASAANSSTIGASAGSTSATSGTATTSTSTQGSSLSLNAPDGSFVPPVGTLNAPSGSFTATVGALSAPVGSLVLAGRRPKRTGRQFHKCHFSRSGNHGHGQRAGRGNLRDQHGWPVR